jgi:peroxiredoxin
MTKRRILRRASLIAAMFVAAMVGLQFNGCTIREEEPLRTGSAYVTLAIRDSVSETLVTGARIRVDGVATTRLSPALISGLDIGNHTISAFKPGYVDTSASVEVSLNAIDTVRLETTPATDGALDLVGAPDGTILLINNLPVDTVPVSVDYPTLFPNIGIGIFEASAYLPGHATELPAKWTVELSPGNPVSLSPIFAPLTEGTEIGNVAPPFLLQSDWGSKYGIQDYRGKVCLVTFFFYNCSACLEEFPYIAEAYRDPRYAGKVQFFGVDFIDSYSTLCRFRPEHDALGIEFPLLNDQRQTVKAAYNVYNNPANFIVDATGRVRLVRGGISEAMLRQTLDEALNSASGPTFSFVMRDTLITYDDRTRGEYHEFYGVVTNQLTMSRTLVYTVEPVSFPDTSRHVSICTYQTCYASHPAPYILNQRYEPMQVDSAAGVIVYNMKNYWQDSTATVDTASFYGDYTFDFSVNPADNPDERITYRLHLQDNAPMITSRRDPWTSLDNTSLNRQSGH